MTSTRDVLAAVDEAAFARPAAFDRAAEVARFHVLAKRMQQVYGELALAELNDDGAPCSYLGQVVLPEGIARTPEQCFVVVSNFGGLVAVTGSGTHEAEADFEVVAPVAASLGYVPVPGALLAGPYAGSCADVAPGGTWMTRYFSWRA